MGTAQKVSVPADALLFYWRDHKNVEFSNFYPCKITIDGKCYNSTEHYFQSEKATSVELKEWIRAAPTAGYSKRAAHILKTEDMDPDWEERKVDVMRTALYAKFTQHEELRKILLATGERELHEDSPTDMVWGMHGEDLLGKLLMELRAALRSSKPETFLRKPVVDRDDYKPTKSEDTTYNNGWVTVRIPKQFKKWRERLLESKSFRVSVMDAVDEKLKELLKQYPVNLEIYWMEEGPLFKIGIHCSAYPEPSRMRYSCNNIDNQPQADILHLCLCAYMDKLIDALNELECNPDAFKE